MKKMVTGVLALVMVLVMVGCGQKDNGVVNGVAKDGATIGEGAIPFCRCPAGEWILTQFCVKTGVGAFYECNNEDLRNPQRA